MKALNIGLSGLTVGQLLIDLTGQNIANANTPGYHRQLPYLSERTFGLPIGDGVLFQGVRRAGDDLIDTAVTQNVSDTGNSSGLLSTLQQIESYTNPGTGSLDTVLEQFFNQTEQLVSHPDDQAQREVVLANLGDVTKQINSLANNFQTLSSGLDARLNQLVSQVNADATQIADLNGQIARANSQGLQVSELQDQRDELINQVAQLTDVRTINGELGQKTVLAGGVPIVIANQTVPLVYSISPTNQGVISAQGTSTVPTQINGGQVAGLLQVRNTLLPDYQNRLNNLTQQLVLGLDEIHATGIPLTGPLTQVNGNRAVTNVATPLANAGLAFPPQAGTLTVTVTDFSTGQRTNYQAAVNPATQSLNDLATAISAIPHLQGVVNTQSNTLSVLAQSGFGVDFAGRLPSQPDTSAITGTAAPQISGTFTGTTNDTYTFTVVGTGTVGVSPNLSLQVTNSSGAVLANYNIGQGYSPGTPLPPINGVDVNIGAGTVNAGDNFTVRVTGNSDTANFLTALGLNTLLVGNNASNIAVRPDLIANPQLLDGSRTGDAGDSSNLQRLVQLRDAPLLNNGTQTFTQYYGSLVGDVGSRTQQTDQANTANQLLGNRLTAEQQSAEGVDPNEELVNLIQFERSYDASARYITVINNTLNTLVNIIQ